jgi:hydrogenase expression/formation protein HypE
LPRARRLPTGKVPAEVLRRLVFPYCGVPSDRVLQGPGVGEDAAVIEIGESVLIAKANPITGAEGRIGWLAVHVNANDVASCGASPQWFLAIVLLPEGADESLLESIMIDMHNACCEVGVSLIGGHTEITPKLDRPIISGFMMGEVSKDRHITTGGARVGDQVILTKGAGIEGTGILATDLAGVLREKVNPATLRNATEMLRLISVVPEALKAVEEGGVHSLHTPTEGGLLNGVWETAEAANMGVVIREDSVPVADETRQICEVLDIDPLKLMGSGALLIVVKSDKAVRMIQALDEIGVKATIVGKITPREEGRVLITRDGERMDIEAVDQDEVYRILDKYGINGQ